MQLIGSFFILSRHTEGEVKEKSDKEEERKIEIDSSRTTHQALQKQYYQALFSIYPISASPRRFELFFAIAVHCFRVNDPAISLFFEQLSMGLLKMEFDRRLIGCFTSAIEAMLILAEKEGDSRRFDTIASSLFSFMQNRLQVSGSEDDQKEVKETLRAILQEFSITQIIKLVHYYLFLFPQKEKSEALTDFLKIEVLQGMVRIGKISEAPSMPYDTVDKMIIMFSNHLSSLQKEKVPIGSNIESHIKNLETFCDSLRDIISKGLRHWDVSIEQKQQLLYLEAKIFKTLVGCIMRFQRVVDPALLTRLLEQLSSQIVTFTDYDEMHDLDIALEDLFDSSKLFETPYEPLWLKLEEARKAASDWFARRKAQREGT